MCIFSKSQTTNAGAQAVEDTKTTPRADARSRTPDISAARLAAMYGGYPGLRRTVLNPGGGARKGEVAKVALDGKQRLGR